MWFEAARSPHLYRRNNFRSFIERHFRSLGADWKRRMVKEIENFTEDYSENGFVCDEGVGPSNVPIRMQEMMIVMIVVITMMIMRRIRRKKQMRIRPRRRVLSMSSR